MNGVQTRFKCKLDVKRCKRFVFPPSSLLPRSNALKTKAIRYFQTDRTLTRIVSPPLEGVNAGVWTVGVILGSNEMGLTQEETRKLPAEELNRRMAAVRKRMYMAGAHYVVNTIAELPEIIEIINHKMN